MSCGAVEAATVVSLGHLGEPGAAADRTLRPPCDPKSPVVSGLLPGEVVDHLHPRPYALATMKGCAGRALGRDVEDRVATALSTPARTTTP